MKINFKNWIFIAVLGTSNPALADWQWTRWGMTTDQVLRASRGAARHSSPAERASLSVINNGRTDRDAKIVGQYETDGFAFATTFMFDPRTDRLVCVYLSLRDKEQSIRLETELKRIYGAPDRTISSSALGMRVLYWDRQDEVSFVATDRSPSLRYCSRQSAGL